MNGQTGKRANGQRGAPGSRSDFRRQLLWLKAQEFADKIADVIAGLPRERVAKVLGSQLLRASASIAANIAEGYGRFSRPAYRNHLSIARGSAFESESWLDLLHRRKYLDSAKAESLIAACVEVQKLLTVRMQSLAEGKTYAVREDSEAGYGV